MTKSYENIEHYASTSMYRMLSYYCYEQCNCFESCTTIISEVIGIQKTQKMTSCTEFSEAFLMDIVKLELIVTFSQNIIIAS
jgi:hypothetical protein